MYERRPVCGRAHAPRRARATRPRRPPAPPAGRAHAPRRARAARPAYRANAP
jgi:hypothetical protein